MANILLDDFDKELESRGHRFVRYAEDFVVFTNSKKSAARVFDSSVRYLEGTLKLPVNREKSKVCGTHGLEFLGFEFRGYRGVPHVSVSNERKLKQKVCSTTVLTDIHFSFNSETASSNLSKIRQKVLAIFSS